MITTPIRRGTAQRLGLRPPARQWTDGEHIATQRGSNIRISPGWTFASTRHYDGHMHIQWGTGRGTGR